MNKILTHVSAGLGTRAIARSDDTGSVLVRLLDDYERTHFTHDASSVAVSDATLNLIASWYPGPLGRVMRAATVCLMDDPLLKAFGYRAPNPLLRAAVRAGMRLRGRAVRLLPPRHEPFFARRSPTVRGYKNGYRLAELGTFAPGTCPVPHEAREAREADRAQRDNSARPSFESAISTAISGASH
ncbi:hypothetical protein [Streptomyces sp. NPDC000880]